jgi:hypothetical protein
MATLFFSYSHVDESLRINWKKHLSSLRRRGVISSWHDRRITAGEAIDGHIDTADVILLIVGPGFHCFRLRHKREMKRALERHDQGNASRHSYHFAALRLARFIFRKAPGNAKGWSADHDVAEHR